MPHLHSVDLPVAVVPASRSLSTALTTPLNTVSALGHVFRRLTGGNMDVTRVAASGMTALALRLIYCQAIQDNKPFGLFDDLALVAVPTLALMIEVSYRAGVDPSEDRTKLNQFDSLVEVDADNRDEKDPDKLYLGANRNEFTETAGHQHHSNEKVHHKLHASLLPLRLPHQPPAFPLTARIGRITSTSTETDSFVAESPAVILLKALLEFLHLSPPERPFQPYVPGNATVTEADAGFRVLLTIRAVLDAAAEAKKAGGSRKVGFEQHLGITFHQWEFTVQTMLDADRYHHLQEGFSQMDENVLAAQAIWAAKREWKAMDEAALEHTVLPSVQALENAYLDAFHDIAFHHDTSSSYASSSVATASQHYDGRPSSRTGRPLHRAGTFSFFNSPERNFESPAPLSRSSTFASSGVHGSRRRESSASGVGVIPHRGWRLQQLRQRPRPRESTGTDASITWSTGYPRRSRSPSLAHSSSPPAARSSSPLPTLSDEETENALEKAGVRQSRRRRALF